jgi:hypothetical protein
MKIQPPNWNNEIRELEQFFASAELPEKVRINAWGMVVRPKLFIDSHMSIVKAHNGEKLFEPYLVRLQQLKTSLEKTDP